MIKQKLLGDLKKAVEELGYKPDDIVLSIPPKPGFGDYSTNIALQLAKQSSAVSHQSSEEIANKIVDRLQGTGDSKKYLNKIEVAGAGFLNFFIKEEAWGEDLGEILEKGEDFGKNNSGTGKKVILEHTSVNPNKAMHIGHLRNAFIGDALARILKKNGYKVETQNYIDDTGVQVIDTYIGLKHTQDLGITTYDGQPREEYYWDIYAAINQKYEENPVLLEEKKKALKEVEDPDSQIAKQVKAIAEEIVNSIIYKLGEFRIVHDLYVWESDILKFKFWDQAFKILQDTPGFEKETTGKNAGTWLVRFGGSNEEHSADKIFIRSDGTTTYTAKDFAYNLWKFGLLGSDFRYKLLDKILGHEIYKTDYSGKEMDQFDCGDLVYTVIDERQSYPQQVIKEVFNRLGYEKQAEKLRHIAYGVVTLSAKTAQAIGLMLQENKKSYAMAGRKGIGVKVSDLQALLTVRILEERKEKEKKEGGLIPAKIANSAIKYYMLKYNSSTEVVFDFGQALALYGATGPYLQYTHARAFNILEKAGSGGVLGSGYLPNENEISLIKLILEWPDLVKEAGKTLEPSVIATYAFELAQSFNAFYEKNRVIGAQDKEEAFRIILVQKFQMVFKDVLDTLGIEAPEKM